MSWYWKCVKWEPADACEPEYEAQLAGTCSSEGEEHCDNLCTQGAANHEAWWNDPHPTTWNGKCPYRPR